MPVRPGLLNFFFLDPDVPFGWPDTSYTLRVSSRDADGPAVHLLQL
ncbi:hypothetical protein [Streptomyces collinus]